MVGIMIREVHKCWNHISVGFTETNPKISEGLSEEVICNIRLEGWIGSNRKEGH